MVDLNFGTNVMSPRIYRDFDPKEDVQLNMSDVATMVKDIGMAPTRDWLTDRFDVDLEEEESAPAQGEEAPAESPAEASAQDTGSSMSDSDLDKLISEILGEG